MGWALGYEAAFFLVALAMANGVSHLAPRGPAGHTAQAALRQLSRTFLPFRHLHTWQALATAIFAHNVALLLPFLLDGAVAVLLLQVRPLRLVGVVLMWAGAAAAVLFWLVNAAAAGLVVGAVARALHAATGPVFVGLLPHGLFEIFALTLAFALPTRVVVRRLMGVPWTRSAQEVAPLLVRASAIALVSLALAAVVESTVSPQVLRWLVPGYRVATASISTLAPRGKAATPTVTRAGRASPKARA